MKTLIARFLRDESGTAAIDYVVVASLVSIMIIIGATKIGVRTSADFQSAANAL